MVKAYLFLVSIQVFGKYRIPNWMKATTTLAAFALIISYTLYPHSRLYISFSEGKHPDRKKNLISEGCRWVVSDSYPAFFLLIATTSNKNF
jgi:hypothetical protein